MMSLSLLGVSLPMSDSAAALTMSVSVMYALLATGSFLVGLSLLLAGAYPVIPAHGRGRVFHFLPFAFVALVFFASGGVGLYFSTYDTFTVPSLGSRPAPDAWLVFAMPMLGTLSVALQIFLLLRRRAQRLRMAEDGA